jgi:hypothetical protein
MGVWEYGSMEFKLSVEIFILADETISFHLF